MTHLLLVALGGALGSAVRHAAAVAAAAWLGPGFPYSTLAVNLAGCFLIGLVQQIAVDSSLVPEDARLFLTTGVMGGLTTYSAFSYETARLIQVEAWAAAWLNVVLTTALCLALCFLGLAAGRVLLGARG
ncbi:MAG: fluoride efflux transporter CrcB [Candidatus Rokuibacteriota bacterium]